MHQGLRAHRALFVPAARAESTWPHASPERQSVLWPGCSGTIVALRLCLTCSHLSVHISAASRPHPGRRRPPGHTSAQVGNLYARWPLDRPAWREAACLLHKPRVSVCPTLDKWEKGADRVVLPLPGGHTRHSYEAADHTVSVQGLSYHHKSRVWMKLVPAAFKTVSALTEQNHRKAELAMAVCTGCQNRVRGDTVTQPLKRAWGRRPLPPRGVAPSLPCDLTLSVSLLEPVSG